MGQRREDGCALCGTHRIEPASRHLCAQPWQQGTHHTAQADQGVALLAQRVLHQGCRGAHEPSEGAKAKGAVGGGALKGGERCDHIVQVAARGQGLPRVEHPGMGAALVVQHMVKVSPEGRAGNCHGDVPVSVGQVRASMVGLGSLCQIGDGQFSNAGQRRTSRLTGPQFSMTKEAVPAGIAQGCRSNATMTDLNQMLRDTR